MRKSQTALLAVVLCLAPISSVWSSDWMLTADFSLDVREGETDSAMLDPLLGGHVIMQVEMHDCETVRVESGGAKTTALYCTFWEPTFGGTRIGHLNWNVRPILNTLLVEALVFDSGSTQLRAALMGTSDQGLFMIRLDRWEPNLSLDGNGYALLPITDIQMHMTIEEDLDDVLEGNEMGVMSLQEIPPPPCDIVSNGDGTFRVICPDGSEVDLGSGSPGCTLTDKGDGTAQVICPDGTSFDLPLDGGGGCQVQDNGDGTATLSCADGSQVTFPLSGAPETPEALLTITLEAAGDNCVYGGQKVEAGVDNNGDGVLDADEIDSTVYVCDGQTEHDNDGGGSGCSSSSSGGGLSLLGLMLLGLSLHRRRAARSSGFRMV